MPLLPFFSSKITTFFALVFTPSIIVDVQKIFFDQVMQDEVIYKEAHKINDVLQVLEKLNDR